MALTPWTWQVRWANTISSKGIVSNASGKGIVSNAKMHNMKEDAKDSGRKKDNTEHGHLKVKDVKMVSHSCQK
jgi:hypothetical protein